MRILPISSQKPNLTTSSLNCACKGLQKSMSKLEREKPKALRHFKVDPVLKIDETCYKQAETM